MARFVKAGLYLVTSESLSAGRSTVEVVTEAVRGGVRLVQLREKEKTEGELVELAVKVRKITAEAGAILLINDRLDIAMECGADGVHLGLEDMPVEDARRLSPDMVIGASSHSLDEAVAAAGAGASYLNIGPIYPTKTKNWQEKYLGLEAIKEIAPHLRLPWTVMGGIKKGHIPDLMAAGARTIAVVTALTMAKDIAAEAREMLEIMRKCGKN